MKVLNLRQLLSTLKIETNIDDKIEIKKIVTNIREIADDTLVFHIDRKVELDNEKFSKLKNCFIITEQAILYNLHKYIDRFIFVRDIEKVYQQFIAYYRNLFDIKVVAVTGTCGKTTTKEMIKQILSHDSNVTGTISSKNALRFNHHYLMNIDDKTEYGVYETALTEPGHIIYSSRYYKPEIGVITNIGIDHLNECKTLDNYIRTKGEMMAALDYKGTLIINSDDENIRKLDFTPFKGKIITFGINNKADYTAKDLHVTSKGIKFILIKDKTEYQSFVPGIGNHNVYNALAALAVLCTLGKDIKQSIDRLAKFVHISSHLQSHEGINGSIIIDDTWSSNPTSVEAALSTFKDYKDSVIAVIGQIAYLGEHVVEQCRKMGKMLIDYNVDYLVTKDSFSRLIGREAIKLGFPKERVYNCKTDNELKEVLEKLLKKNTIAIFKISMFDSSLVSIMKHFIVEGNK